MRTTLTLEDDVAARLLELRRRDDRSLKELVNEAMRRGLDQLDRRPRRGRRLRTRSADLGRCLAGAIDNVAELLALAEGDSHR